MAGVGAYLIAVLEHWQALATGVFVTLSTGGWYLWRGDEPFPKGWIFGGAGAGLMVASYLAWKTERLKAGGRPEPKLTIEARGHRLFLRIQSNVQASYWCTANARGLGFTGGRSNSLLWERTGNAQPLTLGAGEAAYIWLADRTISAPFTDHDTGDYIEPSEPTWKWACVVGMDKAVDVTVLGDPAPNGSPTVRIDFKDDGTVRLGGQIVSVGVLKEEERWE
jgi:hypothetical protein